MKHPAKALYYRDGRQISEDGTRWQGAIRDHVVMRVPSHFRDGMSPLQRSVATQHLVTDTFGNVAGHRPGYAFVTDQQARDAKARAYAAYDARVSRAYKNDSGTRTCPSCDGSGEVNGDDCPTCHGTGEVSADYESNAEDIYNNSSLHHEGLDARANTGFGSKGPRGEAEGSACTVKGAEYPDFFGAPGTIVNGRCVPNDLRSKRRDTMTVDQIARSHSARMARIYAMHDAELANAWRQK
jgi:hypothetical protein